VRAACEEERAPAPGGQRQERRPLLQLGLVLDVTTRWTPELASPALMITSIGRLGDHHRPTAFDLAPSAVFNLLVLLDLAHVKAPHV
jgi:hypothetical protein